VPYRFPVFSLRARYAPAFTVDVRKLTSVRYLSCTRDQLCSLALPKQQALADDCRLRLDCAYDCARSRVCPQAKLEKKKRQSEEKAKKEAEKEEKKRQKAAAKGGRRGSVSSTGSGGGSQSPRGSLSDSTTPAGRGSLSKVDEAPAPAAAAGGGGAACESEMPEGLTKMQELAWRKKHAMAVPKSG